MPMSLKSLLAWVFISLGKPDVSCTASNSADSLTRTWLIMVQLAVQTSSHQHLHNGKLNIGPAQKTSI